MFDMWKARDFWRAVNETMRGTRTKGWAFRLLKFRLYFTACFRAAKAFNPQQALGFGRSLHNERTTQCKPIVQRSADDIIRCYLKSNSSRRLLTRQMCGRRHTVYSTVTTHIWWLLSWWEATTESCRHTSTSSASRSQWKSPDDDIVATNN